MARDYATLYHVLLQGRSMGPYDRRTIVGMCIKKALAGDTELIDSNGAQLTVADLLAERSPQNTFNGTRSGSFSFSVVQATFTAALLQVKGRGFAIPAFRGEVEARVQAGMLRIAGRYRRGLRWREDRVKLPLKGFAHARIVGSRVDLWLRLEGAAPSAALQQLSLELFSAEAAGALVEWMPVATPPPSGLAPVGGPARDAGYLVWIAVIGVATVVALVGLVLALRVF
ncbi:MAG: hypothetical protein AB7P37_09990 [Ramlibacter sp.]